jgi:hypothetical protein
METLHGDQWDRADKLSDALLESRLACSEMRIRLGWTLADLLAAWRREPNPAVALEIVSALEEQVTDAAWQRASTDILQSDKGVST